MQNIKTFGEMFQQLLAILDRKQKRSGIILFFLLMCSSLLEMLGVSVVIPFIFAMLEPEKVMANRYVKDCMEFLHVGSTRGVIGIIAAAIVMVYVLKNGIILVVNYYQINFRNSLEKDMSVKMLSSYMKRPYTFFLNINSAEILRGVYNDIIGIALILDNFSALLAETMTCLFISLFVIYMNSFIAFYLIALAGITALLMIFVFKKKISECGVQTHELFTKRYQHASQAINGIKEITVMQRRENFVQIYEEASERAKRYNNIYLFISKMPSRLIETIFLSGLVILVWVSMDGSSELTEYISVLGALGVAAARILPSISNITNSINNLVYNRPALEAVYTNMREAQKYDAQHAVAEKQRIEEAKIEFTDKLCIEHVFWRYRPDLSYVIKDLSLKIHKGEAIALIGSSGAGKTTLADMIMGLLRPEKGQIIMDGREIGAMLPQWSRIIGYVPQSVFLTDDTIRNNVAFGIKEEEQDEGKIWNALEQAQLAGMVRDLEQGLDTIVGERGIKFSGGQRQRMAIARALYYNPEILVLDEATSALDHETESAVMESIDALHGKKTLIIVAHRLSTIRMCDKIYEIIGGKAVLQRKEKIFMEDRQHDFGN